MCQVLSVRSIIALTIFHLATWNLDKAWSLHSFDGTYQQFRVLTWNVSAPDDKVSIYEQLFVFIQTCNFGAKLSFAINDWLRAGLKSDFLTNHNWLWFDGILARGKCHKLGLKVRDKWACGQIQDCWKSCLTWLESVTNVPDPQTSVQHC